MAEEGDTGHSLDFAREHGMSLQKRHSRVTVKYNRKQLQQRLDVEKWIDEELGKLFEGKNENIPEEVNIDDLLHLQSDEERTHRLQVLLQNSCCVTEDFIAELLQKLHGLHKQEELQSEGVEHPYLHSYPHHRGNIHHHKGSHQTL